MKSEENPQTDAGKSLGGYFSSTPVPNGAINVLFDTISSYTVTKSPKETIALGLINRLDYPVENVELKLITDEDNVGRFRVAAVAVGEDYRMEQITSRYNEPLSADFTDASFYRAAIEMEVMSPMTEDEEVMLYPFGVSLRGERGGWRETEEALQEAFSASEEYEIRKLSRNRFRIVRRDATVVSILEKCYAVATGGFRVRFDGRLANKADNTVLLRERMEPGDGLGLWIQRTITSGARRTNRQILHDYLDRVTPRTEEEVTLEITYDLIEE